MAIDPRSRQRSPSPSSFGRQSPSIRVSQSRVDQELFRKDKSYRRYASGIDRALSLFDTTLQEWADYISFLGRLLKALQAHPTNVPAIPFKQKIAKRLAQCLNPSLPSGVHQKALEIYAYIFELIGTDTLSKDLPLYLPGLCPILSFASLSVRPLFLNILEAHVVKTRCSILRPALKAIILSLLPGLEDETSEDFQRVLGVLEKFKSAVKEDDPSGPSNPDSGAEYFWQCFFLASIASSSRRQGVLAFLTRKLPRLGEPSNSTTLHQANETRNGKFIAPSLPPDVEAVLFPEPGLLVRCFVTGLSDEQMLIQRGFLDLLVTQLPLHGHIFQARISAGDRERLVSAAIGVVTRRDMSLNRRLWAWLLGPDPVKDDAAESVPGSPNALGDQTTLGELSLESVQTTYFQNYGLQPLISSVLNSIAQDSGRPSERARPFRICLSLMDRWEVGSLVIPEILMPALDNVQRYQTQASSKSDFSEVLRSASVFFDGVESGLICGQLFSLATSAFDNSSLDREQRVKKLILARFIVSRFNISEEDMVTVHLPLIVLALLNTVRDNVTEQSLQPNKTSDETSMPVSIAFEVAQLLIRAIPERAFFENTAIETSSTLDQGRGQSGLQSTKILPVIQRFYKESQEDLHFSNPPFSAWHVGELLLRESSYVVKESLENSVSSAFIEASTQILVMLLGKLPKSTAQKGPELFSVLQKTLSVSLHGRVARLPFPVLSVLILVTTTITTYEDRALGPFLSRHQIVQLLPLIIRQLWAHLSPWNIKYHVEVVRCIWQLQTAMPHASRSIEACISGLMIDSGPDHNSPEIRVDAARKFALLWAHSMQSYSKQSDQMQGFSISESSAEMQYLSIKSRYKILLSRPLFLLLDALCEEETELYLWTRGWLQALQSIDKLFRLLAGELLTFPIFKSISATLSADAAQVTEYYVGEGDDLERCVYYLQTISNVLRCITTDAWAVLAKAAMSDEDQVDDTAELNDGSSKAPSLMVVLSELCVRAININPNSSSLESPSLPNLQRTALAVLEQLLTNPFSGPLADLQLDIALTERLLVWLGEADSSIQIRALNSIMAALSLRTLPESQLPNHSQGRKLSKDTLRSPRQSLSTDRGEPEQTRLAPPPPQLGKSLIAGFSSPSSQPVLENWVNFLSACLPLFSQSIFQILIPLVECLCTEVSRAFQDLQSAFDGNEGDKSITPEARIIALLSGLECCLAYAHHSLMSDRTRSVSTQSLEPPQGFFGNMVSGVFNTETPQTRTVASNNRLSVVLSFRDTARTCFEVWSWDVNKSKDNEPDLSSLASFTYISTRTRNKARRLLEHLFSAEPLECLENLVEVWSKALAADHFERTESVIKLLHVLDGSKPKNTIPALFNAIYSRTNPNALDSLRKSTLTSDLSDTDLVAFLSEYTQSIDDDAMDEIWNDCMAFLRDVLSNPFPHRQILPRLLEFTATLGEKVENTSFGDQRMRRDLSDLFVRILTANFTIKPTGFSQEHPQPALSDKGAEGGRTPDKTKGIRVLRTDDILAILASVVPKLPRILIDSERVHGAAYIISSSAIGPAVKSKSFPENLSIHALELLSELTRLPNTQKFWKKDVTDAFNHPRFFLCTTEVMKKHWLTLLQQWTLGDKDRMPELLLRLTQPSTAGIMFGVGASSARLEADRKTQLNLKRIALLILASRQDSFIANLEGLQEKLEELLMATPASSPSSATRSEIYMVFRAIVLRVSPVHLSSLWSVISMELQAALSSVLPNEESNVFNHTSVFQACKLLDTLIVIAPEEFQLQEWLFITDSIDAVYHPARRDPIALADELSEELGVATSSLLTPIGNSDTKPRSLSRKPLLNLDSSLMQHARGEDLLGTVLKPFFSQLSIYAFESTYSMAAPDWEACADGLLADLLDESMG